MGTRLAGLRDFSHTAMRDKWTSWRDWHHLSLVSDQGSDMVSAMHAVEYCKELKLVVTTYYDIEHGVNRNVWGAIDSVGYKPLMMLVMCVLNLPSQPDDSDLRFRQVRDLMTDHYNTMTPETSPIFQFLSSEMHKERRSEVHCEEGENKDQALWRVLKQDSYFRTKPDRCCIARFCAIVGSARRLLETWYSTSFELAVSAIESNMITSRALPKIALKTSGQDVASVGEEGTTSRKVVGVVDRTLRSCGANGVVISLGVIANEANRRHVAIVVGPGTKAMQWSGECSTRMRSVKDNQAWLIEQLQGGLCKHVCDIFQILGEQQFLTLAEFLPVLDSNLSENELVYEDEFAGFAGRFVLALGRNQLRRFLWMFGYPHRLTLLLGSDAEAAATMRDFEQDLTTHRAMLRLPDPPSIVIEYIRRSHFNKVSVQQVVEACSELGFRPSEPVRELLDERTRTIMTSTSVEHLNKWQKNSRQVANWGGRYRRPQTCLAASVRGNVLGNLHRYTPLPKDLPAQVAPAPLQREDLCVLPEPSMDFTSVKGTSAKAPYYSPTAVGVPTLVADIAVLRQVGGRFEKLEGAWRVSSQMPRISSLSRSSVMLSRLGCWHCTTSIRVRS